MSSKFVFVLLLAFALFVAIIDAHHYHFRYRCKCDDDCYDDCEDDCSPCKCPCKNEKPYQVTSQNPETEAPTTTSTSTTPVIDMGISECFASYQIPRCRKGVCPKKELGIFCCCSKDDKVVRPLKNSKSKCNQEYKNQECDATINVTCHGCDDQNFCKCVGRRVARYNSN